MASLYPSSSGRVPPGSVSWYRQGRPADLRHRLTRLPRFSLSYRQETFRSFARSSGRFSFCRSAFLNLLQPGRPPRTVDDHPLSHLVLSFSGQPSSDANPLRRLSCLGSPGQTLRSLFRLALSLLVVGQSPTVKDFNLVVSPIWRHRLDSFGRLADLDQPISGRDSGQRLALQQSGYSSSSRLV